MVGWCTKAAWGRVRAKVAWIEMKFIVDNNVGKLARPLRALGYDTTFINPIDDSTLIEIARREGRIILTKDTGILQRRLITSGEVPAFRVDGDDWRRQLAQVVRQLELKTQPQFTRCIECNTPLHLRTREEARPYVPAYVYRTQKSFLACPSCRRHYWQGTHWQRMNRDFARILNHGS